MSRLNLNPDPGKLIFNFFFRDAALMDEVVSDLEETYGPVDLRMAPIPFGHTTYYDRELGPGLRKAMVSFERLFPRDGLPEVKHLADQVEEQTAQFKSGVRQRRINIDPGLLFPEKFILATAKNFPHRIYVGRGVYADLTLIYRQERFETLPWTYTDYVQGEVLRFLGDARNRLLQQLREMRSGISDSDPDHPPAPGDSERIG